MLKHIPACKTFIHRQKSGEDNVLGNATSLFVLSTMKEILLPFMFVIKMLSADTLCLLF